MRKTNAPAPMSMASLITSGLSRSWRRKSHLPKHRRGVTRFTAPVPVCKTALLMPRCSRLDVMTSLVLGHQRKKGSRKILRFAGKALHAA